MLAIIGPASSGGWYKQKAHLTSLVFRIARTPWVVGSGSRVVLVEDQENTAV